MTPTQLGQGFDNDDGGLIFYTNYKFSSLEHSKLMKLSLFRFIFNTIYVEK